MPIYEYECTSCKYCFEVKQRFEDDPVATCPQCQQKGRRVLRAVPIIFKGSGFYVTDYRKSSPTTSVEASKETGEKKADVAKEPVASKAEPVKASSEKKAEPVAKKE
ncbi:MAG: zinc ribbon domain-containing protein [Chloroflexi bacterium]|nr:zinc ribbon domain-containing protein [Chloroflexota bacterium]